MTFSRALRVAVTAAAIAETTAFAPFAATSSTRKLSLGSPAKQQQQPSLVVTNALLPAALPAAAAVKWIAAGPAMYALMSFNEYFTHRYYQHAEYNKSPFFQGLANVFNLPKKIRGGGHVEHHAETYDDMLLKTDDAKWMKTNAAISLSADPWRGTAFTWQVTGMMLTQMLFTTLPVFVGLLKFNLAQTFGMLLPALGLHAMVWNALHPNMHGLPEVPLSAGVPSLWLAGLRNSWYFRYLYQNHEGHHVAGGQANYNVACPLVDHLVGTYQKQASWRPRVDAFLAKKEAKKLLALQTKISPELVAA
mmetsp:Transcript_11132/g.18903  ORF Transcript_11132/g.18903 Transcript_11132/m.18903 type:complete len:306 (+) Transcript_11132:1-918(+)